MLRRPAARHRAIDHLLLIVEWSRRPVQVHRARNVTLVKILRTAHVEQHESASLSHANKSIVETDRGEVRSGQVSDLDAG